MTTLQQDLRHGARMFLKKPGFTLIAVLTLALGIGACAMIFSVVDALLLRSLPFPEAERLVQLREVGAKSGAMFVAEPNFEDVRAQSRSFSALALAAGSFPLVVTGGSEPVRARVAIVSGQFFETLGVQPMIGRTFLPEEEKFGGPVAVLVSHGYWQKMLGARTDFSAMKLNVDGAGCNVVGVMPPSFNYPLEAEVWMTRNSEPPNTSRTAHNWPVIGRLRPGVTLEQARAEVSLLGKQLRQTFGEKTDAVDFALFPLQQFLTRNVREGLLLLLGAVGLLLLVACANVSNLLLAQFTARQREFTVRAALGASRLRLVRQLISENLLITLPAALLGVLLAGFGVEFLLLLDNQTLPQVNVVAVDKRVTFFAVGLATLIAVLLGLLPAFKFRKQNLPNGLKDGRGQSADAAGGRLRGALVVTQIGLTLVLLTGAGLLGRSFIKLLRTDPGFKPENALAMTLSLPSTITPQEDERLRQFYSQLIERISQLPGVVATGGINALPLADRGANGRFLIDDNPALRGEANYRVAGGGYFPAMGMRLLQGRLFDKTDTVNSPHVAVISQSLAARYWPKGDAIGQRIQFGNMDTDKRLLHVVGIVSDVRDQGLETEAAPTVYAYSPQRPQWWQVSRLSIVVRSHADPQNLIPQMREAVAALRSDVPLRFRTLEKVFSSSLDQRRFSLVLYGVFAAVALVIAAIGIYGVVSYGVARRIQELGIRVALGAQSRDVLRLVIGQGMKLALIGVAAGMAGAFALTGFIKSMLYGVSTNDPLTFALIALLFVAIALLACWLPARRATKVDPMVALRCE